MPPRGIFNLPLPHNLITVPSCLHCNNSTSKDEELFRAYLGMHIASKLGAAQKFFSERTIPSIRHNKGLQSKIFENMSPIFFASNNKSVEKMYSMKWDSNVHDKTIEKITRGLYYHEFKKILGDEVKIEAYWFRKFPDYDLTALFHRSIQRGAFSYYFNIFADSPRSSVWFFQFYNAHWAGAIINPDG